MKPDKQTTEIAVAVVVVGLVLLLTGTILMGLQW